MFQDQQAIRRVFLDTWAKVQVGAELEPMQALIAKVILWHPEYHGLLNTGPDLVHRVFDREGETNPFLHMGLHIALTEQIQTDRPAGVSQIYRALMTRSGGDGHAVEHQMIECLGTALWSAQRQNALPDPENYLQCLRKLLT